MSSYSTVWDARKGTFDNILNNLDVLRREVEDEKEEQDRKEGMDERSDHEEEEGHVTGEQTPAVKEIEDQTEREQSRDSGEVDEDIKEEQFDSNLPTGRNSSMVRDSEADMEDADEDDEVQTNDTNDRMYVDE